jgi:putative oxidoreductase
MPRRVTTALRVLLGATMLVSGALKFIQPEIKGGSDPTLRAFIDSGWLWQLIGAAEALGGLALVVGLYVPLGLAVLAPVVVGIFAFSVKTGGDEMSVGVLVAAIHFSLIWRFRDSFRALAQRRSAPTSGPHGTPVSA